MLLLFGGGAEFGNFFSDVNGRRRRAQEVQKKKMKHEDQFPNFFVILIHTITENEILLLRKILLLGIKIE